MEKEMEYENFKSNENKEEIKSEGKETMLPKLL